MAEVTVAADELRLLIERIERLEEEKKAIGDDVRDVYGEAKARGYNSKIMRQIVRLRKMETHDRQEMEALLDTYKAALGLASFDSTPLGSGAPAADEPDRYDEAVALVVEHQKASTSWLQRTLGIGYNAAAKLVERMERRAVVSGPDKAGRRTVLRKDGAAPDLRAVA